MTILEEHFYNTKEAFFRLLYPASCAVCARGLLLSESGLCGTCGRRLSDLCFHPEEAVIDDHKFEFLDQAWALTPYESPVKEILTAIKFHRKRWLVRIFADLINPLSKALAGENSYDVILPIPVDRTKLLNREFNQAELFARLMAAATGIPLRRHILQKPQPTSIQSRLGQKERLMNLTGAFRVSSGTAVRGKNILLVDDIFTTGATAEESARTLKSSGASRVDIFAIASTAISR